jgi:nitrate/TMAO reductase-like tetraheme cytochrome c subunit
MAGLWSKPKAKWLLGIPLGAFLAFGLGMMALGATNYVFHKTSTNEFCYGCHSIELNVKPEYEASSHFSNRSGVRASCADCHLPHDNWFALAWAKTGRTLEIFPEMMGKTSTPEKFEAHRGEMAESVWQRYRENDSGYCRSCHSFGAMNLASQERRTARRHSQAQEKGQTCVQCHYGIAHAEPENAKAILEKVFAEGE